LAVRSRQLMGNPFGGSINARLSTTVMPFMRWQSTSL